MKLQVLGTGCVKCKKLAENAEETEVVLGIDYELEKVTTIRAIMKFGVLTTPALVTSSIGRRHMTTRRAFTLYTLFSVGILLTIAGVGAATAAAGRMLGDVGIWGNWLVAGIFFLVGLHLLEFLPVPWSGPGQVGIARPGDAGRLPPRPALRHCPRPLHLRLHGPSARGRLRNGGRGRPLRRFPPPRLRYWPLRSGPEAAEFFGSAGVRTITEKAQTLGLQGRVDPLQHDIRLPLPFPDATFDACYSHMLFCRAMSTAELHSLAAEVRRILKPGGVCIYTVRHTEDPHHRTGIHRGEDLYEVGGFIVHFFSREKVEPLAEGYRLVDVQRVEEGSLPRKLFYVVQRKEE